MSVVSLLAMPAFYAAAGTDGPIGCDGAAFAGDPYYSAKQIQIDYTHWDSSAFYIQLRNPNGTIVQTWNPSRNYPNIGHIYYSLDGKVSGKWALHWESTTSGEAWDYAMVGYYEMDYGDTKGDFWGNTTTIKAGSYRSGPTDDGQTVQGGVSFEVRQFYDDFSGYPAVELFAITEFQDQNLNDVNYIYDLTVYVQKVWWDSGVYGPSYGSNNTGGSIDKSAINFLDGVSHYASKYNLKYPSEDPYGAYIGNWVIVAVSALTGGTMGVVISGLWLTANMLCTQSTSGGNPESADWGLGDTTGSAHWDKIGTQGWNSTSSNMVELLLDKGDASYCFKIWASFRYRSGDPIITLWTVQTQAIYLCLK